ncbi:quinoprotein relay system zinc metallohydrolase 2 [Paracoccus sp. p3-h83]|uniref:quinoprotein relay system zinc metallohydrolase 2 n=1 Tax=Paracoccus sp. p3-h83 TaxID=3342805 RepID=UPI0035B7F2B0
MFHLIASLCLTAQPGVCADTLLPAPQAETAAECSARAPGRIEDFQRDHGVTATGWRCTDAPPALDLTPVAPGIWAYFATTEPLSPANRGMIANAGVIITDQVTVIDPGGTRAQGAALFAAIRARTDAPIRRVILTHGHPDHIYGAEVFIEAGAEVTGHHALPDFVAARAETWAESIPRQIGDAAFLGSRAVLPGHVVTTPELIDIGGGHVLELTPQMPAHTGNDMTVFHPASGTLFTGDLVFHGLTPVVDGSLTGWIDWLSQPPDPRVSRVVPGHGGAAMGWDQATAPIRRYLTGLADQTRAEIAAGAPISEAVTRIGRDLSMMDGSHPWAGFDETNSRNATAAFAELEWE